MKAPAFWYRKRGIASLFLAPIGHFYRIAGLLRRALAKPYKASIPVICIGNIVAGGAGKTPTCLALKKLLLKRNPQERIVFVTRGYGGCEKGPLRVDLTKHTAKDVGDEALLLAQAAPCWIGTDRAATIREAEKESSVIIMDDGMQNPHVLPTTTFLVVDGTVGFGNGQLIPAGPLRETLNDAFSRIDAVVMIGKDKQRITSHLAKPVCSATLRPGLSASFLNHPKVLAFAGIGRPSKFYDSCRVAGLTIVQTQDFPDHYTYTDNDLATLTEKAAQLGVRLITTTKDFVRIPNAFQSNMAVLEIELVFEDEMKLLNLLSQGRN
ncbi:MAG: tetraacyldisaccharide 4'-kinase [Alphaproteobacteria bacterium]|nr:tetraacyldisaccharide 4'-kinase [Alphaproteobacteria bacterium]